MEHARVSMGWGAGWHADVMAGIFPVGDISPKLSSGPMATAAPRPFADTPPEASPSLLVRSALWARSCEPRATFPAELLRRCILVLTAQAVHAEVSRNQSKP